VPPGPHRLTYHGQPMRQQDAIKAIEAELNRLCQVGDKSANLISILPL